MHIPQAMIHACRDVGDMSPDMYWMYKLRALDAGAAIAASKYRDDSLLAKTSFFGTIKLLVVLFVIVNRVSCCYKHNIINKKHKIHIYFIYFYFGAQLAHLSRSGW
jgi:phage-related holin